jgi:hypothetical protein
MFNPGTEVSVQHHYTNGQWELARVGGRPRQISYRVWQRDEPIPPKQQATVHTLLNRTVT